MKEKLFLKKLNSLLSSYSQLSFLSGYPIKGFSLKPKRKSSSGFWVFKAYNPHKKIYSILKVVAPLNYNNLISTPLRKFNAELTVYTKIPQSKPYIPKLISFSTSKLKYLEIEYLEGYLPIGDSNGFYKCSKKLLSKIFEITSNFHIKLSPTLQRKLFKYDSEYYKKRIALLKKEIENSVYKNFLFPILHSIEKKLPLYKKNLEIVDTFVIKDRHPGHYYIYKEKIKTFDFDTGGVGTPVIDFSYLYILSYIYSPSLAKELLKKIENRYFHPPFLNKFFYFDLTLKILTTLLYFHSTKQSLEINKIKTLLEISLQHL